MDERLRLLKAGTTCLFVLPLSHRLKCIKPCERNGAAGRTSLGNFYAMGKTL